MTAEIRPFKAEDLLAFEPRDYEGMSLHERVLMGVKKEKAGPAFTGVVDGKIIGCAGVGLMWDGVGEAWAVLSHDIELHRLWFHRTARRGLVMLMAAMNLHRLQASVRIDIERNCRWLEAFGFVREGIMHGYAPDKTDCVRYALVRG